MPYFSNIILATNESLTYKQTIVKVTDDVYNKPNVINKNQ